MRPVSPGEFLALPRRVALSREPHDRFESTWRDYRQRRDVHVTFGEFAEKALAGGFPFHTAELMPQVDYCGLTNQLIRWDFAELAEVLGVSVPHVNRTDRGPVIWPAAIGKRFAERYAADLELWEGWPVLRSYCSNSREGTRPGLHLSKKTFFSSLGGRPMSRKDVNELLAKALDSPEFRRAFVQVSQEKATRPVRPCRCVVVEIPEMAQADDFAHITPGTVTAFVAREGEPLLGKLTETIAANDGKEFNLVTDQIKQMAAEVSRRIAGAGIYAESQPRVIPSFAEISYANKTLVGHVYVDDLLRVQVHAFPYNGGYLDKSVFHDRVLPSWH